MKQLLTDEVVRKLEPPSEGHFILYDTEIRGFGIRVTANGVKKFVLNYSLHGRERRKTIGEYKVEYTVVAARTEAGSLRNGLTKGIDPMAASDCETMNELSTMYIDEHAVPHKSEKSVYEDQRMLDNVILPKLGTVSVLSINTDDLRRLHNSMRATPYEANRVRALLSKMFSLAVEKKMRPDNPVQYVKKFREHKRQVCISTGEIEALTRALDKYPDQGAANAIRLMILTGCRPDEALSATWDQFDLKPPKASWTKPSHHTKEKKTEHVAINWAAVALLRRMKKKPEHDVYLFPGRNPDTARTTVRNTWHMVCRNAGLATKYFVTGRRGKPLPRWRPKYHVYDLRHTFASQLVSGGASLPLVGKLLGHTQPATTDRYVYILDEAQRRETNRFANIIKWPKRA